MPTDDSSPAFSELPFPTYVRPGKRPGAVWFRMSRTGVYHADHDCPALRDVIGDRAAGYRVALELDLATGDVWRWRSDRLTRYRRWYSDAEMHAAGPAATALFDFGLPTPPPGSADYRMRAELSEWRACLRCGVEAPRGESAAACGRCFLVGCDCDD